MSDYAPGIPVPVPDLGVTCHECGGPIDRDAPPRAVVCSPECKTARTRRQTRDRVARHRAQTNA